ncbi:MAG: cation diffusion facilitator family transporter [Bacteroidales bacterium]|nr:cation diffusion facilitator family transporter [Bacteroidales bacterium]
MEHNHKYDQTDRIGTAFRTGIALNVVFIILEVIYGVLSNSMALISDAGHNFSDVMALAFSWIAVRLSQRKPTLKFTFGFRKSTILAAILNTILLLAATGVILWETIRRIGEPETINSVNVIIVAAIGILINGITAYLFRKGKKQDLNIRSAFLHFVADALVSLGVVIAGFIMLLTGVTWIDSAVSFIIVAIILYSSYRLLVDSVSLALDAVPGNIDIGQVREYLASIPGVTGIHDLHIWALSTRDAALTVHLETGSQTDVAFISMIQKELHDRFSIDHTTIQVEYGGQSELCNDCN